MVTSSERLSSSYARTLAFLDSLDVSAIKLGLARIRAVLESLRSPHRAYPTLHIAGTNGKGSVAAMLSAILMASGYRVGTTTSPHLSDVRERLLLNGELLSQAEFTDAVHMLKSHLETHFPDRRAWPTYFEFLVALAFHVFQQCSVDWGVIEVGLGGRLDATNVLESPAVSVITSIGYDHMTHLGHTLAEIAGEKAGILKPGVPLVLGPNLPDEARKTIFARAEEIGCPVVEASASMLNTIGLSEDGLTQQILDSDTQTLYSLSLLAPYQVANLATVLAVIQLLRRQGISIPEEAVQMGLKTTRWPGRFQVFPQQCLLLDGSHNAMGFQSLETGLRQYFPDRPLYWLLSLRNNRPLENLLSMVGQFPQTVGVIWTRPTDKPWLYHDPTDVLRQTFPYSVETAETPEAGLRQLQQCFYGNDLSTDASPLGVVTGSLYTVGALLPLLPQNVSPDGLHTVS